MNASITIKMRSIDRTFLVDGFWNRIDGYRGSAWTEEEAWESQDQSRESSLKSTGTALSWSHVDPTPAVLARH